MAEEMDVPVCTRCGMVGQVKRVRKGTGEIELVLWLLLIVPGILYSMWRSNSAHNECEACGSSDIVSSLTPVGREVMEKFVRGQ